MKTEREQIKQRMDEELEPIRFSAQEQVIRQTHPRAFGARLSALWNREIEISPGPLGALSVVILVTVLVIRPLQTGQPNHPGPQPPAHRVLIEAGGNTYWKDIYEQAVKRHED
ncbi:hypothetical protein GCM10010912_51450 [Paenibacillus albidus]|uniref:DUF3619 family protein n=1 Tax=Paenibacillus albidus TaxID=2041023 RepID=A0A917CW32_9BACL|nr:hypothetical protein [Paenibacillus albidus]GGG00281.1 hypothetical protein GCM10010912_51450 [Paenibacillus albidus]